MKSYPYIGKDNYGQVYLMLSSSDAITMDSDNFTHTPMEEDGYKNITHEYLQSTYGVVVSPEHAEFIIELCLENSISFYADSPRRKYFAINGGKLYFFCIEIGASNVGSKKITIPLPPKQIQTATPEEEFEMTQIMKNAGDNLVLGCEQDFLKAAKEIVNELREEANCRDELLASCDEWPKIGDEVLACSSARRLAEIKGKAVKVIGKCTHSDGDTILTVEHSSLGVFAVAKESCIKPKTPEEELRDEIKQEVFSSFAIMPELLAKRDVVIDVSERIANNLVKKYITKKPQ